MKRIIGLLTLISIACLSTFAQDVDMNTIGQGGLGLNRAGQTSMVFLQVGVSAKAAALGNAYTAVGKGAESIFTNPAGLTEMTTDFEGFVSSTQWFADIKYLAGAAAWNTGNYGVIGVHFITVDYGQIKGAMLADANVGDDNYILTGDVANVGAYSLGLSYVSQINPKFSIGGTVKLVGQRLGQLTALDGTTTDNNQSKVAVDMGLKFYPGLKSLRLAMSMRNFSTFVRYQNFSFSLPIVYSVGIGMNMMDVFDRSLSQNHALMVSSEFVHPNNYSERLNTGIEYKFMEMISLRAGYETNHDVLGWSGGAGFAQTIAGMRLEVDYSYSNTKYFNGVNRFSLLVGF